MTIPKNLDNYSDVPMVEEELSKLMSLKPSSLKVKINRMGQCAVNDGRLYSNELDAIDQFFDAWEQKSFDDANRIMESLAKIPNKSDLLNEMMSSLNSLATASASLSSNDQNTDDSSDNSEDEDWDTEDVLDSGVTVMEGAGVIGGGLVAGKDGAIMGGILMGFTGKIWKKLVKLVWGVGSSFKLGPNGEDCQPPFLILNK